MPEPIRIDVAVPNEIAGSAAYTVAVTITNTGSADLQGVQVQPQVLPGRILTRQVEVRDGEESELEGRRWALIEEMESQVVRAYIRQRGFSGRRVIQHSSAAMRVLEVYASMFARPVSQGPPPWTGEAFAINDWEDVEVLEKEIICHEPADGPIRRAFLIDKGKLQRCLAALADQSSKPVSLDSGPGLAPGSSLTFPFVAKAPHLLRRREVDLQFRVTYRDSATERLTSHALTKHVTMFPSAFAVPTGGLVGAVCGQGIRVALQHHGQAVILKFDPLTFGGAALLGLVFAILTSRKPDTYKVITSEDFIGGFLIGVAAGLFTDAILDRFRGLLVPRSG